MNLGKRRTLAETVKARVRARVEHPFRIVKRVFGCDMVCYRGLERNVQRLALLPGFSNLMIAQPPLSLQGRSVSGICRTGPAGAETAVIPERKRSFGASGPPKTGRCSREGQFPQPKPENPLQIRGSLRDCNGHHLGDALGAWRCCTWDTQPFKCISIALGQVPQSSRHACRRSFQRRTTKRSSCSSRSGSVPL